MPRGEVVADHHDGVAGEVVLADAHERRLDLLRGHQNRLAFQIARRLGDGYLHVGHGLDGAGVAGRDVDRVGIAREHVGPFADLAEGGVAGCDAALASENDERQLVAFGVHRVRLALLKPDEGEAGHGHAFVADIEDAVESAVRGAGQKMIHHGSSHVRIRGAYRTTGAM